LNLIFIDKNYIEFYYGREKNQSGVFHMNKKNKRIKLLWMIVLLLTNTVMAEEIRRIEDNSFLLEEAYNQENGVVQHIQGVQFYQQGGWVYNFTQEWPVPTQNHQLSYVIPYIDLQSASGIGDILINYRYQAIRNNFLALAPRISLILPSGDYKKELGHDAYGIQVNIPISIVLGQRWVTHWNLGTTYIPKAKHGDESQADIQGYNFGGSLIYILTNNLNFMLEGIGNSDEVITKGGAITIENSFYLNPGFRYAIDFASGLQMVLGLSFPIGIGPSSGDNGVFVYLSLEHPLF
jgi:hypothetical protein